MLPAFATLPLPGPGAMPAPAALDLVFIEGLRGLTVIGIHDSELHVAQPLVIDVVAGLPRPAACDTDRIADTLDYSVLRERLLRLLAEHRLQLLEALAETIADIVLQEFHAAWVQVKVVKPCKFDDVAAVGVQICRAAGAARPLRPGEPDAPARQPITPGAPVLQLIGAGMVPHPRR